MTTQELLNMVNDLYPNAMPVETKIRFMNTAMRGLSPYFGVITETSFDTVEDQDVYDLPGSVKDISEIISLGVGRSTTPKNRYDYIKYKISQSEDDPMQSSAYFQVVDDAGVKHLVLYPVPSESGVPVVVRYRKQLTELTQDEPYREPEIDKRFHDLFVYYCVHAICASGASPDTIQADIYMQKYNSMLGDLWKFEMNKETGQKKWKRDNPHWHDGGSWSRGQ